MGANIKYNLVDFQGPREFYSRIIQLFGLKFILQDTRIMSLADIEIKILKMYCFLKPPF